MLLASALAPLVAQAQADPARLDDFAVSASSKESLQVEQLTPEERQVSEAPPARDRSIAQDAAPEPATPHEPQLSSPGGSNEQAQLSKRGAAPDQTAAAISSRDESRPQGVVRIGGQDRCDPQLAREKLQECERILELRAQEFHAPAAPELSAEQKLLAEQQSALEAASPSASVRVRLASRDQPDADLESNQELAAIYLDKQVPADMPQPQDQTAPQGDATLAQVIDALQAAGATGQGAP